MTMRTWLYGQLADLIQVPEERVFAKKTMKSAVEEHPYIVFKLGNATNFNLSEDQVVNTQFFQIYIHDYSDVEAADYQRIDNIIEEIRSKLHLGSSAEDGVISTLFLETSQDLNDDTLGTIMKYMRFQSMVKEQ